ncbi:hypothetical protein EVAR_35307_1 [Eumeta japonica]|uniref:Uncharacterized protein n=1 Tax=Eumeta variegata TaxID=151549 RepID=A0A4C1XMB5_EUMVA|nr:hypothetical protein EVAR_35307_1 [Eumeta japonica]
MESAVRTNKNMTHAALPRSEAFHLRLEVQARARNERQRGTIGLRVRQRSTSVSLLLKFPIVEVLGDSFIPASWDDVRVVRVLRRSHVRPARAGLFVL